MGMGGQAARRRTYDVVHKVIPSPALSTTHGPPGHHHLQSNRRSHLTNPVVSSTPSSRARYVCGSSPECPQRGFAATSDCDQCPAQVPCVMIFEELSKRFSITVHTTTVSHPWELVSYQSWRSSPPSDVADTPVAVRSPDVPGEEKHLTQGMETSTSNEAESNLSELNRVTHSALPSSLHPKPLTPAIRIDRPQTSYFFPIMRHR
jgi:hypothetical protein